eukprot:1158009-Pyramimonas_sp.AAC.1
MPSASLPPGFENVVPMLPSASPLGTSDTVAWRLCSVCFPRGSRDTVPRNSGPCSDTANVNVASCTCP